MPIFREQSWSRERRKTNAVGHFYLSLLVRSVPLLNHSLTLHSLYPSIELLLSSQTKYQPADPETYLSTVQAARKLYLDPPSLPEELIGNVKKLDRGEVEWEALEAFAERWGLGEGVRDRWEGKEAEKGQEGSGV